MMKLATLAAVGVVGTGLIAAPMQPAKAWCGALLPLCVAGAVVGTAAVATAATAATIAGAPYAYAPPAYYAPPAPGYVAPAPVYAAPAPAYYGYPAYGYAAPVVTVGVGPVWWHGHWVGRPYRRWHYY